jgi:hypothetical protein
VKLNPSRARRLQYCSVDARKGERIMTNKAGQPADDVSSAPESGTVRDDTSGNAPSDRGYNPGQQAAQKSNSEPKDDPSVASEER